MDPIKISAFEELVLKNYEEFLNLLNSFNENQEEEIKYEKFSIHVESKIKDT